MAEREIQEAAGRKASAQAALTRQLTAVSKKLGTTVGVTQAEAADLQLKIAEALDRFTECHNTVIRLCQENDKATEKYDENFATMTQEVEEKLAQLARALQQRGETGQGDGAGLVLSALSPGSQKTLKLVQLAMSAMTVDSAQGKLEKRLDEQERRHREETGEMTGLIRALKDEVAALRQPGREASTPVKERRRVTFGMSESLGEDAMNKYLSEAVGSQGPALADREESGPPVEKLTVKVSAEGECEGERVGGDMARGSQGQQSDANVSAMGLQQQLMEQSLLQHRSLIATMKAPQITIPKFEGDPLEYTYFMNTFDELVDEVVENPRAKLTTLLAHCEGRAYRVVRSAMHADAEKGYEDARAALAAKFGTPFLVSQAWLSKLLGYPPLKSGEQIESFAVDLPACRNSLVSLGCAHELCSTNTLRMLVAKLPFTLRTKWRKINRGVKAGLEVSGINNLVELVEEAAEELTDPAFSEAAISAVRNTYDQGRVTKPVTNGAVRRVANCVDVNTGTEFDPFTEPAPVEEVQETAYHTQRERPTCVACGSSHHFTSKCREYKALEPVKKVEFVRRNGLCVLCLSSRHQVEACPLAWKCQERGCSRRHHTSLHQGLCGRSSDSGTRKTDAVSCVDGPVRDNSCHLAATAPTLPLTPVVMKSGDRTYKSYALLDQGSTITLCHKRVSEALGLLPVGQGDVNLNTINSRSRIEGNVVEFDVASVSGEEYLPVFEALEVESLPITLTHLADAQSLMEWSHLKDLRMDRIDSRHVDLLVGTDNAHLLEPMDKKTGQGKYEPYAVLTPLGWTVFGKKRKGKAEDTARFVRDSVISEEVAEDLEQFFKLEEVPEGPKLTREEQYVIDLWDREWRLVEGHIELPIPFKVEPPCLPNNYYSAKRALLAQVRRLRPQPKKWKQYVDAMEKYERQGHSEEVTEETVVDADYIWYLLHHGVDHPRKPDVTRVVKNASGKYKGVSLNMVTYQGPVLMNGLAQVLVRFRRYRVGVAGDIEGMYSQVWVPVRQRDSQRYLWFRDSDPDKEIVIYRMKSHIFGAGWSPAAASYALRKTVDLAPEIQSKAAKQAVEEEFYVDDWLGCDDDEETAVTKMNDVQRIVAKGSFNVCKFTSNSRKLLASVPEAKRAKDVATLNLFTDRLPQGVTLGSGWDQETDLFTYQAVKNTKPLTRRGVTSYAASFFDPLGLLGPFLMPAKLLLRETVKAGTNWDDDLPEDLRASWEKWILDAEDVKKFRVCRWLGCRPGCTNELHVFGDSSIRAYGAAAYLCVRDVDDELVSCVLVMAKSKLAPKQVITIPRLEPCAAVLAVNLGNTLEEILGIQLTGTHYWSDSAIVVHLINGDPAAFKPFFGNRISCLQQRSRAKEWGYVPGPENPADIISRGPDFLAKPRVEWPSLEKICPAAADVTMEMRKQKAIYEMTYEQVLCMEEIKPELKEVACMSVVARDVLATTRQQAKIQGECREGHVEPGQRSKWLNKKDTLKSVIEFLQLSSSYKKTRRMVAWVQRFSVGAFSRMWAKDPLKVVELDAAERGLVKASQRQYLSPADMSSRAMVKLAPINDRGVLRVGGRIVNANIDDGMKHPYIVPPQSPLLQQVLAETHRRVGHASVDITLAEIRKKFWILGGRQLVKAFVKSCIVCRRISAPPASQMMGNLPVERLSFGAPPFTNTGVDLFGPLAVVVRRSREKRYGVIYTCMTSRAVHLEVAVDLSMSSFLNTLQRFITRRGKPAKLHSDNGTNFVASDKEVSRAQVKRLMESSELRKALVDEGIEWLFNTPGASHQGGAWERMIRTVRKLLLAILQDQGITADRLETALCVVEQILNDRPLTRLLDDPESLKPLTPAQILNLRPSGDLVPRKFSAERLKKDWQQAQYLGDVFWSRWVAEYLPDLQQRTKWMEKQPNAKTGELVLIVNEAVSRSEWPLGVVKEVHPGDDGLVRNVTVKTASGSYRRPITKIVRLEGDIG